MSIPTRSELIERALASGVAISTAQGRADFALAEGHRMVIDELEALRDMPGFKGLTSAAAIVERTRWCELLDARLSALRAGQLRSMSPPAVLGPHHADGCKGNLAYYSGEGYDRVRVCQCGAEDHAPALREQAEREQPPGNSSQSAPRSDAHPKFDGASARAVVGDGEVQVSTPAPGAYIELTPQERQSGLDRVRWAELLIRQLPDDHDGRNSWLLNFGGHDKPGAESQAPSAHLSGEISSERAEGRAASSPCPPPALSDADVLNEAVVIVRREFELDGSGRELLERIERYSAKLRAPKPVDVFGEMARSHFGGLFDQRAQDLAATARDWFAPLVEALGDIEGFDNSELMRDTASDALSALRQRAEEAR